MTARAEERSARERRQAVVIGGSLGGLQALQGLLPRSIEAPVNFARPSIGVLFESAADVYGAKLVGVLLSGASADGAAGLQRIQALGGAVFCQSPESALEPTMPRAGCARARADRIAAPERLGLELSELCP